MYFLEKIIYDYHNFFSNLITICTINAVAEFDNKHPVINYKWTFMTLFSVLEEIFYGSIKDYHQVHQLPYYLSYKLRQILCDAYVYVIPNNTNIYFDIIDILLTNISYNLKYLDKYILFNLIEKHYSNMSVLAYNLKRQWEVIGFMDFTPFDRWDLYAYVDLDIMGNETDISKYDYISFVNNFLQGIYFYVNINYAIHYNLMINSTNQNLNTFYNSFESNLNYYFIYLENSVLIFFFFIFCFVVLLSSIILIINKIYKNNKFILNSYLNRINKIMEYDFGPNIEIKLFFFFFLFTFFFFFFKNFNNFLIFKFNNDYFIFYFIFLVFLVLSYPFMYILHFGIYFITYIKGTDIKKSKFTNLFFDSMSLLSYFSRFFLQIIRILLLLIVYYLMHEYFFDSIISEIYYNYYTVINNSIIINLLFSSIRLIYELIDFLMIFFLQIVSFFSVIFILFSFLFSSNLNIFYENYFKNKNK